MQPPGAQSNGQQSDQVEYLNHFVDLPAFESEAVQC